jgi:hypothetical protein
VIIKGDQLMIANNLEELMKRLAETDMNADEQVDALSFAVKVHNEFTSVMASGLMGMLNVRRIIEEKLGRENVDEVLKDIQPSIDISILKGLRSIGLLTTIKCVGEDVSP